MDNAEKSDESQLKLCPFCGGEAHDEPVLICLVRCSDGPKKMAAPQAYSPENGEAIITSYPCDAGRFIGRSAQ